MVALLAALAAGCGGDDSSSGGGSSGGVTKVTVGTLPIANSAAMYLGMKKGFFKEEKLEIEPQVGEGGAALMPPLLQGDSQFAFVGVIPAITAVAKKLPVKIIASSDDAAATEDKDWQTLVVPKGSPIKSVKDLPNKTVAVNALKGLAEVVISPLSSKQGVDYKSVKLLEVPFPEMPAALDAKRVDAALLTEPFLTAVLAQGGTQIDAPSVETLPSFPNGCPHRVKKYIRRTATWWTASPARSTSRSTTRRRTPTRCARSIQPTRRRRRRRLRSCACRRSTPRSTTRASELESQLLKSTDHPHSADDRRPEL